MSHPTHRRLVGFFDRPIAEVESTPRRACDCDRSIIEAVA